MLFALGAISVDIDPLAVHLPDFHEGVAHRLAVFVENAPAQVRDLANGRGNRVVDDDQVVVGVERQPIRVERPFGPRRCRGEFLREQPTGREERRAGGHGAEEGPTAPS